MTQPRTFKKRVLTKNALVITLSGEKAGAAQIFNYENVREIRMDLEKLEVNILMTYEDSYIRVFDVPNKDQLTQEQLEQAKNQVLRFYNDLITATMKLSKEEIEIMKKQAEEQKKRIEEMKNNQGSSEQNNQPNNSEQPTNNHVENNQTENKE